MDLILLLYISIIYYCKLTVHALPSINREISFLNTGKTWYYMTLYWTIVDTWSSRNVILTKKVQFQSRILLFSSPGSKGHTRHYMYYHWTRLRCIFCALGSTAFVFSVKHKISWTETWTECNVYSLYQSLDFCVDRKSNMAASIEHRLEYDTLWKWMKFLLQMYMKGKLAGKFPQMVLYWVVQIVDFWTPA